MVFKPSYKLIYSYTKIFGHVKTLNPRTNFLIANGVTINFELKFDIEK